MVLVKENTPLDWVRDIWLLPMISEFCFSCSWVRLGGVVRAGGDLMIRWSPRYGRQ
jgi:hypothetical protein